MLRLTLHGRPARLLRPHELARGVRSLLQDEPFEALEGTLDVEWISAAGVILARHRCATVEELALLLPSLEDDATEES